jgi:hypothetical protein
MPDIVIPEAVLDEFLKSLHAKVAAEMQEFRGRLSAHEALLRAQLEVARERKLRAAEEAIEQKLREAEEKIEPMIRAVEEDLERKMRAADEELERKLRAAEDEIARLRQLERLRQTAAIERGERRSNPREDGLRRGAFPRLVERVSQRDQDR